MGYYKFVLRIQSSLFGSINKILENTYRISCVSKRREKFTLNINMDHWIIFIDKEAWPFNRHLWRDTFVDYNFHVEY